MKNIKPGLISGIIISTIVISTVLTGQERGGFEMGPGQSILIYDSVEVSSNAQWTMGNQDIVYIDSLGYVYGISAGDTYLSYIDTETGTTGRIAIRVKSNPRHDGETAGKYHVAIDDSIAAILHKLSKEKMIPDYDSRLKVSTNKRYLVERINNEPFVFLSQTLWSMARRLSREEVIRVLDITERQQFTVIQILAHGHYMGENYYGASPFMNKDFLKPQISDQGYDWWDHLEFIVEEAVKRGIYVCLLPTWREQWDQEHNLHQFNAMAYGKFIGERFRHLNPWIIWMMGGDAAPDTPEKLMVHRELAKGVAIGINGEERYDNIMMSYHTHGPTVTTDYMTKTELYMDFHTIQSGHDVNNLEGMIEKSYHAVVMPIVNFEPYYDKNGDLIEEARTTIYWGIFSGSSGTSYGSWNTWHTGARNDIAEFNIPESFNNSYASQIKYLGRFLRCRPMLKRMPDQEVLVKNHTHGLDRILACSATDSSYIMVYSPKGESFTVNMHKLKGEKLQWYWYNPRNGEIAAKGTFIKDREQVLFTPPTKGEVFTNHDWVLIVDDAGMLYPHPEWVL